MSKNSKKMATMPNESVDLDIPVVSIPPADVDFHEPVFTVPKGRSLNCRAGIVAAGKEVTVDMVIGGLATLEHLASVGGLVKE